MTSAETFAKSNTSYWAERLPRLDRFVRAINVGPGRLSAPINSAVDSTRHAIIAELAFEYLRDELTLAENQVSRARSKVFRVVAARVATLADINMDDVRYPTRVEWLEVDRLYLRLKEFLAGRSPSKVYVGPRIAGCGVLEECFADLLVVRDPQPWDTFSSDVETAPLRLIEVKTVERGFRAIDLRQVITYSALMSAESRMPDAIGLVNPRRGTYFECSTDELALDVAGVSAAQLMQQVVFDITTGRASL